jgi:hypothetical protein
MTMTKIWNLTEISELEDPVLATYTTPLRKRRKSGLTKTAFAVFTTIAAIATTVPVISQVSASVYQVPCSVSAVAHSGIEQEPPLRAMFVDRFDANWSESMENALLAQIEDAGPFTKAELEEQTVDSIYFGQQEDVSSHADRLSRDQIRGIVRQRKLV